MKLPLKFPASRSLRLGLFFLILVGLLAGCETTPKKSQPLEARKKYDEAQKYNSLNQRQKYYEELRAVIAIDPTDPFYRVALGNVYFEDNLLPQAEKEYRKAIELNPQYTSSYRQLGRLYIQKKDWKQAVSHLKMALEGPGVLEPHQLYNWLAYSYYQNGQLNEAQKTWQKAVDIKDSSVLRINLGMVYKLAGQKQRAYQSFSHALELDPRSAQAHFELGELYYKDQKFGPARMHYQAVVQLEPMSQNANTARDRMDTMNIRR